ncbi:MAG: DEAD/DEAH box helicase, partial [Phycisphaerales bacterium]|nr:DEAD/DEAH box helicase [Phycisphaerales bacterium]
MKFNHTNKKPARSTPQGGAPVQAKAPEQAAAPVIAHTPVLERVAFTDLGLSEPVLRALRDEGYEHPTPIQAKAIPHVLEGRDILGCAQTGTGKTAAFALPILHSLMGEKIDTAQRGPVLPRALILSPTRELATQIADSFRQYGRHTGLSQTVIFGGVGQNPQVRALQRGIDVLVATPGRLIDLMEQRLVNLSRVRIFVLDEADRMLDMGFIHDIKRVLKLLPERCQNLMFSATYSDDIRALAARFLHEPVGIEVAPRNATADRVEQCAYRVVKDHKRHLLVHLVKSQGWNQVLVFTRTKHGANRLTQQLERAGIPAAAIHGNKSQAARTRALADFKGGRIVALVATEVAARGLDIKELPMVVNYELPNVPEDYVHRIGRTARAGMDGGAVSLVAPDESLLLRDIERLLKRSIPVLPLPEFTIPAEPPAGAQGHNGHGSHAGQAYAGRPSRP